MTTHITNKLYLFQKRERRMLLTINFHKRTKTLSEIKQAKDSKFEKTNELLRLIKKHTDTLLERTKSRPQEKLELKLNEQMETFSFKPPIPLL